MSKADQLFAEEFLQRFAVPLVAGGAVHVGAPLGRRGLRRLRRAVAEGLDGSAAGEALQAERLSVLAELLPVPCGPDEAPRLDAEPALPALLVALHDMAFLLHPASAGAAVTRGLRRRIADHARALCAPLAPAAGRRARSRDGAPDLTTLLSRHSLLHGLFTLHRQDIRVSFWAGSREFLGQEPPPRLLAWRGVRRVQEERWRVLFYLQLLGLSDGAGGGRACLEALMAASPLTDLLNPLRVDPPLDLAQHAALLREPALARAVAYSYLDLGLKEVAGALRSALLRLLDSRDAAATPPARRDAEPHGARRDLATLLCFTSHLHLCELLRAPVGAPLGRAATLTQEGRAATLTQEGRAASAPAGPGARSPVRPELVEGRGGASGSPREDSALQDLHALFAALLLHFPALALPADVAKDPALMRQVRSYGERCLQKSGALRVNELSALCARALGEPVPPPQVAMLPFLSEPA